MKINCHDATYNLGPLHTRAKSRDHDRNCESRKKVSEGRPKTPPNSCNVITDRQATCEVVCNRAPHQMLFQ